MPYGHKNRNVDNRKIVVSFIFDLFPSIHNNTFVYLCGQFNLRWFFKHTTFYRLSDEKLQPIDKTNDVVTVSSSSTTTPDDSLSHVIVSTPQSEKNNTSTITINSNLPDMSNSLASNISQV